MLNTPKIENLKAFLLANHKVLYMTLWEKETKCGTVGCVAGWTCMLEGKSFYAGFEWTEKAKNILGLNSNSLFFTHRWPIPLFVELCKYNPGSLEYAKVVCDAIDYFVEYQNRMRYYVSNKK